MPSVVSTGIKVARTLGAGWLLYRLGYVAQMKSGLLRLRMPPRLWSHRSFSAWFQSDVPSDSTAYLAWRKSRATPVFFDGVGHAMPAGMFDCSHAITEADAVLAGNWRYFGRQVIPVGFPPDWHRNPLTGQRAASSRHWSQIGDFDCGDIKLIWEASRFTPTYSLVRAYAATGDERYPAAFWALVGDWADHNPPQLGPNWKCGQEASLRVMAWCFGLFAFMRSLHTTAKQVALLATMLATHAARIETNIAYARSQKNNHAISEGMGLWTVGLLFPEFKQAEHWRELGRKVLAEEAVRQIYEDGSYIQHSVNYHRLMLHDYLWALRLGELNGQRFSAGVYERVARAVDFLYRLTDPETGQAPNYGSNDGALLLPLDSCDYTDFRPVMQAGHYLIHRERLYPPGPWDEALFWLFGPNALEAKPAKPVQRLAQKECSSENISEGKPGSGAVLQDRPALGKRGYHLLRGSDGRAMIRCTVYRDRPGQADQLHFDLWWRGVNILCDPGTYLYNGDHPWDNGLASTAVHNTVTVDARDQMTRVGHFLWLDWAQGKANYHLSSEGGLEYWEGEHDGYRALGVTHRRAVLRAGGNAWLVVDDVVGTGAHLARLHWLHPDLPHELHESCGQLLLHTPVGAFMVQVWSSQPAILSLVRAGQQLFSSAPSRDAMVFKDELRGWHSLSYACREPALSLALSSQAVLPLRFISLLAPSPATVRELKPQRLRIETSEGELEVRLAPLGRSSVLQSACWTQGDHREELSPAAAPGARGEPRYPHSLLIHQMFIPPAQAGGTRHYELARHLVERGHHFTVIASDLDYPTSRRVAGSRGLVTEEQLEGVRVLRAYTYPSAQRGFGWRIVSFLSYAFTSLLAAMRVGPVDLVIGTTPPMFQAVSAWLVARLRRRPFLLEVRDLWPEFAIDMGVLTNPVLIAVSRWLERFLYAQATHLVVNSPAYRDYLLGKEIPADKISFIPNGVDPEMFDPAADGGTVRAKFGLENKFIVTYAGAHSKANDLDTLLRVANRLRDEPAIHFLLIGDGMERRRLDEQARLLGLSNVTFVGSRPKSEMPTFLAASDACVAILRNIRMFRTTYPNKVFDYMAAGRPTILAIDGVIRQVIEAAGGGVFVQPGDDAALAEAVRLLSRDRRRAREMGLAARAYVVRCFHRRQQAEEFAALVGRLAGVSAES